MNWKIFILASLFCSAGWAQTTTRALLGDETYPESISYQSRTGSLFVGGAGDGSVQEIHADGKVDYFLVPGQDGHSATYGVKVDEARDRLWLVDGEAVYVYGLADKKLLKKIARQDIAPVADSFLNDIAFDQDGNAYITDSRDPHLLKVGVDFQTSLIDLQIPYGNQNSNRYNLNGIVFSPDFSFLIAVKTNDGSLWKIWLDSSKPAEAFSLSEPVTHGDGLTWGPDSQLLVWRNFEDKVSSIDVLSADPIKKVKDLAIPGLATPTSGVYIASQDQLVIVNSQFAANVPLLPFALLTFDLKK